MGCNDSTRNKRSTDLYRPPVSFDRTTLANNSFIPDHIAHHQEHTEHEYSSTWNASEDRRHSLCKSQVQRANLQLHLYRGVLGSPKHTRARTKYILLVGWRAYCHTSVGFHSDLGLSSGEDPVHLYLGVEVVLID